MKQGGAEFKPFTPSQNKSDAPLTMNAGAGSFVPNFKPSGSFQPFTPSAPMPAGQSQPFIPTGGQQPMPQMPGGAGMRPPQAAGNNMPFPPPQQKQWNPSQGQTNFVPNNQGGYQNQMRGNYNNNAGSYNNQNQY